MWEFPGHSGVANCLVRDMCMFVLVVVRGAPRVLFRQMSVRRLSSHPSPFLPSGGVVVFSQFSKLLTRLGRRRWIEEFQQCLLFGYLRLRGSAGGAWSMTPELPNIMILCPRDVC